MRLNHVTMQTITSNYQAVCTQPFLNWQWQFLNNKGHDAMKHWKWNVMRFNEINKWGEKGFTWSLLNFLIIFKFHLSIIQLAHVSLDIFYSCFGLNTLTWTTAWCSSWLFLWSRRGWYSTQLWFRLHSSEFNNSL